MNARGLRRFIDDLLAGRRPRSFEPDDFEAEQIRMAIDLKAARLGADAPRQEFLSDLHRRLAAQMDGQPAQTENVRRLPSATRRQIVVGTSAAAAAAVTALAVDRLVIRDDQNPTTDLATTGGELTPNDGSWQAVGKSSDVVEDGVMHPFEVGPVIGFVRRVDGRPEAVSGVCTHQGCRLWFDKPDTRLRCPCHLTSFSPGGQVLTHQLSVSPAPLPKLDVRETGGVIQVFAPAEPNEPA
ncbi:Rieske (2Fe-2S) protein [Mycolicibacterium sp.]|uniref:QcrA and Rieske domain-containing protein n=1 Tax=Mycolicibacterium sp. TaxID=2320850 RepID=UPI001A362413|nr:Rieske (2Fe-2S) protein [Mycolicibacterium sp.]MBJ7336308.1 Rieske (2Fe-2S) protein [Mycolicibacterium sp.]